MALNGEPYLAGWSEGVLRLYRKAGDEFVQLSTTALPKNGSRYPRPVFTENGYLLASVEDVSNPTAQVKRYRLSEGLGTGVQVGGSVAVGAVSRRYSMMIADGRALYSGNAYPLILQPVAILSIGSGSPSVNDETFGHLDTNGDTVSASYFGSIMRSNDEDATSSVSPDGSLVAFSKGSGVYVSAINLTAFGTGKFGATKLTHTVVGANFTQVKWSEDGLYLFAIDPARSELTVFLRGVADAFTVEETLIVSDTIKSLDVFSSFVAVGTEYTEESTLQYRTQLYRRAGSTIFFGGTLDDIGYEVLWFRDGSFLIDPFTKVAYSRVGTVFTRDDILLSNLAANTTSAGISPHIAAPIIRGSIYQNSVDDLVLSDLASMPLSVMLLDQDAQFDITDTTVSQVTNSGVDEVFGFGWDQGGYPLENVESTSTGNGVVWISDDVIVPIFGGSLTARYALLYSGTTPLIFLDFGENKVFPSNEALSFGFSSGFLSFSI